MFNTSSPLKLSSFKITKVSPDFKQFKTSFKSGYLACFLLTFIHKVYSQFKINNFRYKSLFRYFLKLAYMIYYYFSHFLLSLKTF